jgi:RNA polymerase sigma factor (sigma-70 family)
MTIESAIEEVWRQHVAHVLAALVRRSDDFDAAEDAAQEALLAATRQWPVEGMPDNPKGWLVTVGSRRLVDQWRADRTRADREELVARRDAAALDDTKNQTSPDPAEHDDSLTLLLLCCHPALTRPSQVALTLRAVAGLSTAQIARAFLVPEPTMAQRISRAKGRLVQVHAPFAIPSADELPDRVTAVAHVLYLIFTEGHTATTGADLTDTSLAHEAIRLTRRLHAHLPAADEITGLLALMLLTDARRAARTDADGSLVLLADQDRSRWDRQLIEEGVTLVESVLPSGPVGPYQLQAAIAAVHADATDATTTDWAQIDALYTMLDAIAPGPVVTLNHAVAVAEVHGPEPALAMTEPLLDDPQLRRNHRLYAVRAHLLSLAGRGDEARTAYARAAQLATSIPEQRYLNEQVLKEVSSPS